MKDKTKKGLILGVSLALCVAIIAIIAREIKKPPIEDVEVPPSSSSSTDVVVDKPDITEREESQVPPIELDDESEQADETSIKQNLQPEPESKPQITEEEKTDSTKVPDEQDEKETPPEEPTTPESTSGGFPGFDESEIIQGGEGQIIIGESDGDINNQVGGMG